MDPGLRADRPHRGGPRELALASRERLALRRVLGWTSRRRLHRCRTRAAQLYEARVILATARPRLRNEQGHCRKRFAGSACSMGTRQATLRHCRSSSSDVAPRSLMHHVRLTLTSFGLALPCKRRRRRRAARRFSDITHTYQLQLAMGVRPVLFKTHPTDARVDDRLRVRGRLAFVLVTSAWTCTASGSAWATISPPQRHAEARFHHAPADRRDGHPYPAVALGGAIGRARRSSRQLLGIYTGATLRWSFLDKTRSAPSASRSD